MSQLGEANRQVSGKKYQPQGFYRQLAGRNDGFQLVDDDILRLLEKYNR